MSQFGITSETKSKNSVPFKVTSQHPFTVGYITKVAFEDIKLKDESIKQALVFYLEDEAKERTHKEIMFVLDDTNAKFQENLAYFQSKIKHIYEEFAPFPKDGIGTSATTLVEFYQAIEKAFNNNGVDSKPVYLNVLCYFKLVWYRGYANFPLSPNFIERVRMNGNVRKETTLSVNPKYDKMDNDIKASSATNMPTPQGGTDGVIIEDDFPFTK